jgi:hypothetical protein
VPMIFGVWQGEILVIPVGNTTIFNAASRQKARVFQYRRVGHHLGRARVNQCMERFPELMVREDMRLARE